MATTVYEETIAGTLDSTVVTTSGTGLTSIAKAWMSCSFVFWNSDDGFGGATAEYGADLKLNRATGIVYPYEFYGYDGALIQEVIGGAAGSFSFEASILIEQDGDDVKVTVTGSLGSFVETYTGQLLICVDNAEGSGRLGYPGQAGFQGRGEYFGGGATRDLYGEVTTVDNPTRRFYGGIYGQDGGVSEDNWSDWDTQSDTSTDVYVTSYNGTGSSTVSGWPPGVGAPAGQVYMKEKASDYFSVGLSYNQDTLTVQSTPPTGVSIEYLPTPDDDAEASPQDTNFNVKYGVEEIAFSPSPDIIGQTTPAQSGTFYWVWYRTKYGGVQPDVELTAPGTNGRRIFTRWDYTGGTQEETLLDWGTLSQNVTCHTHYAHDIEVIAPTTNPAGYRWLYWDFPGDDNREDKTQEFVLDEDMTIIATYEEWEMAGVWLADDALGNLHMLYASGGNLRYQRLGPRETEWGAPVAVTETGEDRYPTGVILGKPRPAVAFSVVASPNILAAVQRGDNIIILASADAGANWEEVGTVAGSRPFMYPDAFTTCLLYYDGDDVVKFQRSQGDFSTVVGEVATVTEQQEGEPVAGRWLPHTGQHRAAVPYGGAIDIYVSNDGGASWTRESTVSD